MENKAKVSLSDKKVYWQNLIREWEESGMSQAAFCRTRNITHSNFFMWRRRLAAESTPPLSAVFAPVKIKQEDIMLCKPTSSTPVRLILKNNVRLEIASGIDKATLKVVLDVLGVLPC